MVCLLYYQSLLEVLWSTHIIAFKIEQCVREQMNIEKLKMCVNINQHVHCAMHTWVCMPPNNIHSNALHKYSSPTHLAATQWNYTLPMLDMFLLLHAIIAVLSCVYYASASALYNYTHSTRVYYTQFYFSLVSVHAHHEHFLHHHRSHSSFYLFTCHPSFRLLFITTWTCVS